MGDRAVLTLDPRVDVAAVQNLCLRAADYIVLETGAAPKIDHAAHLISEAPPTCAPTDVFVFGVRGTCGQLDGIVTCLRHFYAQDEWYMGLLLLDPGKRSAGLGAYMAGHLIALARAQGATCFRVAVLDANPRGRKFWERQGFTLERTVAGDRAKDGHTRHVLKLKWEE